jgi:MinD superfamily P-loop ATPase
MKHKDFFQLAVLSGKGGTGKSSLSLAMAELLKPVVLADCDVDAADLFIVAQPKNLKEESFESGTKAIIDPNACIGCGKCQELCRFDAVDFRNGSYSINTNRCEGCGLCKLACPANAIDMKKAYDNQWFLASSRFGPMVHARLAPGEDNSGKLVTQVREEARKKAKEDGKEVIIIDGPPGIGCPVIAAVTGVDYVVLITEPSLSGLSDLQRVYDLVQKFNVKAGLIINKSDINDKMATKMENWAKDSGLEFLGKLPFDETVVKAMTEKLSIPEYDKNSAVSRKIEEIIPKIMKYKTAE